MCALYFPVAITWCVYINSDENLIGKSVTHQTSLELNLIKMFVNFLYTFLFVGVLFTPTIHAEEGQLQKAAPYPPAGYRPRKAFDLPTEGGIIVIVDREGRAFDGEITTTMDGSIETTTVVSGYETTEIDETTTQYPDLQGNKAERLKIHPKFLVKGDQYKLI